MKCQNCGNEVYGRFCTKCGGVAGAYNVPNTSTNQPSGAPQKSNNGLIIAAVTVGGIAVILLVVFLVAYAVKGFIQNPEPHPAPNPNPNPPHPPYSAQVTEENEEEEAEYEYDGDRFEVLNYDDDSCLYPTDSEYITVSELNQLTKDEVALLRNEIYARHGYTFSNEKYTEFFSQKSWYHPNPSLTDGAAVEKYFNAYEKENKSTLVQYEKDMGWR